MFLSSVSLLLEIHNGEYELKVTKNRNDFMKTSFLPKTNEIFCQDFCPNDIVCRNPDNNFIGFLEKRCLHKIILVFTELNKYFEDSW